MQSIALELAAFGFFRRDEGFGRGGDCSLRRDVDGEVWPAIVDLVREVRLRLLFLFQTEEDQLWRGNARVVLLDQLLFGLRERIGADDGLDVCEVCPGDFGCAFY